MVPEQGEQPEKQAENRAEKPADPRDDQRAWTPAATRWVVGSLVAVVFIFPFARRALRPAEPPAPSVPSASPVSVTQSASLYQAGRYEEAIAAAKAALQKDPKAADAYNNMAASYSALHRWDEAIQSAGEAIRLQPDHQLAKNNLAYAQNEKAKAGAAPPASETPDYYLTLSMQHFQAGKFQPCIDASQKALALKPGLALAYNNIAACYGALGMFDEEIKNAAEALRIQPDYPLARNNLAWAVSQKQARQDPTKPRP